MRVLLSSLAHVQNSYREIKFLHFAVLAFDTAATRKRRDCFFVFSPPPQSTQPRDKEEEDIVLHSVLPPPVPLTAVSPFLPRTTSASLYFVYQTERNRQHTPSVPCFALPGLPTTQATQKPPKFYPNLHRPKLHSLCGSLNDEWRSFWVSFHNHHPDHLQWHLQLQFQQLLR